MAIDFKTLLNKKVDDAKRPPALPPGTYHAIVIGQEYGETSKKAQPYVRFLFRPTAAGEDVDQDRLAGIDLSKKTLNRMFLMTDEHDWRCSKFLQSCGINTAGRSFGDTIPEAMNAAVLLRVTEVQSQAQNAEPGEMDNNVQACFGEHGPGDAA